MEELKIFENPEFGQVRTITIENESRIGRYKPNKKRKELIIKILTGDGEA